MAQLQCGLRESFDVIEPFRLKQFNRDEPAATDTGHTAKLQIILNEVGTDAPGRKETDLR